MSKVQYNNAIETWSGTLDSRKTGQEKRERLITRYRKGFGHQIYPMQMHEGKWAEGATINRELIKAAQKEAHAIERAAREPESATNEYLHKAAEWKRLFEEYCATKKRSDKKYTTLYTFTYANLYRIYKSDNNPDDYIRTQAERKKELYESVLPQIQSLVADESDLIANMANIAAVLHHTFRFLWTGFYLVKPLTTNDQLPTTNNQPLTTNDQRLTTNYLVLGPFQGPIACTRIPFNKGVCGTAWAQNQTIIVPNVHDFPGHIACSSDSKSEIVVPIRHNGEVIAVLDIDSAELNTFDSTDSHYLEQLTSLL